MGQFASAVGFDVEKLGFGVYNSLPKSLFHRSKIVKCAADIHSKVHCKGRAKKENLPGSFEKRLLFPLVSSSALLQGIMAQDSHCAKDEAQQHLHPLSSWIRRVRIYHSICGTRNQEREGDVFVAQPSYC